ncbi:asparagine synthase (glutamine-hydrolyzing) [Heliobacterium undosum]|uniref:asparagine synthase (glutamine-hydrolyzing) n=1 Tax=Heliomicrobium undosum TaxID=121734 RepID=A0A845L054_9FIRM|nr:asparagine synthase (glutamine-hydrolyzing) [Heliomicrobium undosum]MZP29513.1 asparagine synthase (glutamine-hydrolyzing) [Heliomicrobium undosum]
MCGIAGIVSLTGKPFAPARVKAMCDVMAHRGPDDAGYTFFRLGERQNGEGGYWCSFTDPAFKHINENRPVFGGNYAQEELARHPITVGLGHRRLSIIDLTHYGHQPMSNSDRRYWVIFNGEIYNFPELKSELECKGHVFRTRTDTEVLLHLWEEQKIEALSRLNGMFAFALYDRLENELILARDRFGVKPLYYAVTDDYIVFASEIKAILRSGLVEPSIDPSALVEYMTFQNIFSDKTLFRNIHLLEPGKVIYVKPGCKIARISSFHTGYADVPRISDPEEARERVGEGFSRAVQRQLISDVPVGAYLSGGMDSGSIVALAGRAIPRLTTFTCGFDLTNVNGMEQGFDERPSAEKLSYLLQTEHYDVVLHAGDMPAAMESLTWHLEDPRVGMCYQNWYVAKLASRFVKVCLAGTGGDELFGGYPWRYRIILDAENQDDFMKQYFRYWHRLLSPEESPQLFSADLQRHLAELPEIFRGVFEEMPSAPQWGDPYQDRIQQALRFEYRTFLQGLLIVEDRISMAHGMETRVPFLDNDLADLAWGMSPSLKVNLAGLNQADRSKQFASVDGKIVLRNAMERFLPEEFTKQKKQGFSAPDENWYRGPSMEYIREILLDSRTLSRPWFEQEFVRRCLDDHMKGQRNHRLLIWSLLSTEWLQRHYIDAAQPTVEG